MLVVLFTVRRVPSSVCLAVQLVASQTRVQRQTVEPAQQQLAHHQYSYANQVTNKPNQISVSRMCSMQSPALTQIAHNRVQPVDS